MPHLNHLPRNISYPSDLFDKWLGEEHSIFKPKGNNTHYRCHFCTSKILVEYELIKKHIESDNHLELLKMNKMSKNLAYVANLCNENYIIQIDTNQYKCMPCNGQNVRSNNQLISHTNSEHHIKALKEYEKKLEQCEMQHLNSDSSALNSNWRDLAILNSMEYDESTKKYKCIACNKLDIKNKKEAIIAHYITIDHTEKIQSVSKEKRDENFARLNAWHIKLEENQIEDKEGKYYCKACNK
ncbi:hypothetical protein Mgra_00007459, partial [Meloidogyne graminicola]